MGNAFSDCFGSKRTKSQGHRLGDYSNSTSIGSNTSERGGKTIGGQTIGGQTIGGQTLNGSGKATGESGGGPSREDMLAAAQKRQDEAKSKGVQRGGGKLSKQLEEQQKNPNQPDSIPDTNLQWRTD